MKDSNLDIAALLLDLSEAYRPSPKFWGYKNASRSIRHHPEFLADLTDKEILKIPGVGPASLRVVREYLDAGASQTVERVVAESGKRKDVDARRALRRNFLSAAMVRKVLSEPKRGAVKREEYFGDFQILKGIDFSVDEGRIIEVGTPEHFFQNPRNERTKRFLDQILQQREAADANWLAGRIRTSFNFELKH